MIRRLESSLGLFQSPYTLTSFFLSTAISLLFSVTGQNREGRLELSVKGSPRNKKKKISSEEERALGFISPYWPNHFN